MELYVTAVVHTVIMKLTAIQSFSRRTKFIYLQRTLEGTRQIYYKQIQDSGLNLSETYWSGLEFDIAYTC